MRSVANTLLSTRNYESSDRNNIVSPFTSSAGINSSNISKAMQFLCDYFELDSATCDNAIKKKDKEIGLSVSKTADQKLDQKLKAMKVKQD